MKDWRNLKGKSVVVQASGVTYRGTVVEAGVSSLLLRAASGFREIPWEAIQRVEEVPGAGAARAAGPSALKG